MGSTRNLQLVKSGTRELVIVAGSFAPDTANPPTDVRGDGFTVARSGAGLFVLTLDKVWPELESAVATVQLAVAADLDAQIGSVDLSAKTVEIRLLVAAVETDMAANANNRVNFVLALKNTSVS